MSDVDPRVLALLNESRWNAERKALRAILLDCGLTEEVKWGKLCFTYQNSNVAIIFGLKNYCGIGFFKGALLADPQGILLQQGKNSQAVRLIRFTGVAEIATQESVVKTYVQAAIEVERAGLKVNFKEKDDLVFPEELLAKFNADPALKAAFEALTPGRRRGYNLYFSAPKQSKTKAARIEKCAPRILAGKGMNER